MIQNSIVICSLCESNLIATEYRELDVSDSLPHHNVSDTSSLYYGTFKQFLQMSYGSGYGDGSRGITGPKPVEVGKEYEVEVTEISRQGDGIARIQGFFVFVKNGKPGQKV